FASLSASFTLTSLSSFLGHRPSNLLPSFPTRRSSDLTFAQNVGADDTTVFSGALPISSQFSGLTNGPKAFDILVPLTTPFVYDPERKSTLLNFSHTSSSYAILFFDSAISGDAVSRVTW